MSTNRDDINIQLFNEVAQMLENGNIINYFCYTSEDCERSLKQINYLVKRMTEIYDKLED